MHPLVVFLRVVPSYLRQPNLEETSSRPFRSIAPKMVDLNNFYAILDTVAAETPETDVPSDAVSPLLALPPELLPPILEHLRSQGMFHTLSKVGRTCRVVSSLVDPVLLREISLAEIRVSIVHLYLMLEPRNRFKFIRTLIFGPRREDNSQSEQNAKVWLLKMAKRVGRLVVDPMIFDDALRPHLWNTVASSAVNHLELPVCEGLILGSWNQLITHGRNRRLAGVSFPPGLQTLKLSDSFRNLDAEGRGFDALKGALEALKACPGLSSWILECSSLSPSLFDHPVLISKMQALTCRGSHARWNTPLGRLFAHDNFRPDSVTLTMLPTVNFPPGLKRFHMLMPHNLTDLNLPPHGLVELQLCDPAVPNGDEARRFYDWLQGNQGCCVTIFWRNKDPFSNVDVWREVFWNYLPVKQVDLRGHRGDGEAAI